MYAFMSIINAEPVAAYEWNFPNSLNTTHGTAYGGRVFVSTFEMWSIPNKSHQVQD